MAIAEAPEPKRNMGKPEPRIDGRLKVTGQARYAADFPVSNTAYGFLVTSTIARGRITRIDLSAAKKVPGVLHIMTHENRPPLGTFEFVAKGGEAATAKPPLSTDRIDHQGEIVALVVAESLEDAREAAYKVKIEYDVEAPSSGLDSPGTKTVMAADINARHKDTHAGDPDRAFAEAAVKLDQTYRTPTQHHNAIELFSTTCAWSGDELTIYEPSQFVVGLQHGLAKEIGVDKTRIRVLSPFIGGAFGSKGSVTPRTAIVAVAAKILNRPIKLVVTRAQGFTVATYRAETRHRIRFGAAADGRIASYMHEAWELTSRTDDYMVGGTRSTEAMYATPNVDAKVRLVKADRNTPGFMRSPPEVPYMYALEAAMDELAFAIKMDPVELRRINDTDKNPTNGAPYTSRSLMQCYDEAAKTFGWSKRNPEPRSMREGDWLIGYGCATASYPTQMGPATARVRLTADGHVLVQIAGHDIGTGAYTVIGQQAAEQLGVPLRNVDVELGDSMLPPGPIAGGSITTASACSAVKLACDRVLARLSGSEDLTKAFETLGVGSIEEYAEYLPKGAKPSALTGLYQGKVSIVGGSGDKQTMYAFGAEFVEVRIHAHTREIRVPRLVGAFAAGRIMNTRTARSQLMGGMIWGISSALHEATEIDERFARYVNDNLADYQIPVNADIAEVDVILVPEEDSEINPVGVKGLGELGNVGTAAAVANAVFHATGVRIRDLPIRLEKLLATT